MGIVSKLWPIEANVVLQDGLVKDLIDTLGWVVPTIVLVIAYFAFRYPDRVPGTRSMKGREHVFVPTGAWPILGHTPRILEFGGLKPLERFLEFAQKSASGNWSISWLGQGRLILLGRPEYIEYVQKVNFENYPKGERFRTRLADLLGTNGIFVADGHTWKNQRKKASLMFSAAQFRDWVGAVVSQELDDVIGLLDNSSKSGVGKIDWPQLLFRFTLDGFAKMAFSADLHCLSSDPASLHTDVPFAVAFDDVQLKINLRFVTPGWQVSELFTQRGRDIRKGVKVIQQVGGEIIEKRLKEHAEAKKHAKEGTKAVESQPQSAKEALKKDGKDLLGFFMDITEDPQDLLVVVLNFIIAGRDTTAQGLSWMFYEILANPQWIERIREEVANAGLNEVAADGSARLQYEEINKLPVTLAVFSEAIRLHPPVPRNSKYVEKDDVIIPQGPNPDRLPSIKVFAGETVAWSDWVMARSPAIWGDDCEEFKPERFLSTDEKTGQQSFVQHGQWKMHVFNAGPRLCLGMNLANYEALAFIAAVVPRYDLKWATKAEGQTSSWPPAYAPSVTHPVKDPYILTVKKRSS